MKKIYFFLFLLFISLANANLKAQNAFFDAQYIYDNLSTEKIDTILSYEQKLTPIEKSQLENIKLFIANPFDQNLKKIDFKIVNDGLNKYMNSLIQIKYKIEKDIDGVTLIELKTIVGYIIRNVKTIKSESYTKLKELSKLPNNGIKIDQHEPIILAIEVKIEPNQNEIIFKYDEDKILKVKKQAIYKAILPDYSEIMFPLATETILPVGTKVAFNEEKETINIVEKTQDLKNLMLKDKAISLDDVKLTTNKIIENKIKILGENNPSMSSFSTGSSKNQVLGNSLETYILDGITKYYADEFKKAATTSYFNIFNSTLGKYGELHALFPETYLKFKNMDPTRFPDLGRDMKDIFIKDLVKLPINFIKYIDEFKSAPIADITASYTNLDNINIDKIDKTDAAVHYATAKSTVLLLNPNVSNDDSRILEELKEITLPASMDEATVKKIQKYVGKVKNIVNNIYHRKYFIKPEQIATIKKSNVYIHYKAGIIVADNILSNKHISTTFNELDKNYYSPAIIFPPVAYIDMDVTLYGPHPAISTLTPNQQIGVAIHGLNLMQLNIQDTVANVTEPFQNIWVSVQKFKVFENPTKLKYFTGLIYQQDRDYYNYLTRQINPGTSLDPTQIYQVINSTYNTIKDKVCIIDKLVKDTLKADKIPDYLDAIIDVLELPKNIKPQLNNYNSFCESLKDIKNIYSGILQKDFVNTIHYSLLTIKRIVKESDLDEEKIEPINNFLDKLNSYGTFATRVINAKSSDEIKDVIKDLVAPSSSYVFKRVYPLTVTLSGHPGFFVGREFLNGKWATSTGVTLPIGFEITTLFKRKNKNNLYGESYNYRTNDFGAMKNRWSLGLFLQAIDLGAILNYRISNDSPELPSEVSFEQLVSPGVTFNIGLPNFPVAIGVGYQYTPKLRKIQPDPNNPATIMPSGNRYFIRVSADIPTINIYKSRNKSSNNTYKFDKKTGSYQ